MEGSTNPLLGDIIDPLRETAQIYAEERTPVW